MRRYAVGQLLLLATLGPLGGCTSRKTPTSLEDTQLAQRIERLVDTFLTSDDKAREASALADARAIFEREGLPTVGRVGDAAAYGFVLINMLGQPPAFRGQFLRECGRRPLVANCQKMRSRSPKRVSARRPRTNATAHGHHRTLPCGTSVAPLRTMQEGPQERGFDPKRLEETDRRTAVPLKAILDRFRCSTYDMVGVEAAKNFVVMVQHQSPEFRRVVLPN